MIMILQESGAKRLASNGGRSQQAYQRAVEMGKTMLDRLGIAQRISLGFGVVLTLLAGLAVCTIVAVAILGNLFANYQNTARQAILTTNIANQLFEARMATLKYRLLPDDQVRAEIVDWVSQVESTIDEGISIFDGSSVTGSTLREIRTEVADYAAAFDRLAAEQQHYDAGWAVMVQEGPALHEALLALRAEARRGLKVSAMAEIARTMESLLNGRIHALRFATSNDLVDFRAGDEHLAAVSTSLETLKTKLTDETSLSLIANAHDLLMQYRSGFAGAQEAAIARNAVRDNVLDALGPHLQARSREMTEAIGNEQAKLGTLTTSRLSWALAISVGLSATAVAGGVILAYRIGRWTSNAVDDMAERMKEMASGNLDIAITGDEHQHELGAMARALRAFRQNGLAKIEADTTAEKARAEADEARKRQERRDAAIAARHKAAVRTLRSALTSLADGDLTLEVNEGLDGEFIAIRDAFNQTINRLSTTVQQIRTVAGDMTVSTDGIDHGAQDLSQRAENQAAALEQVAATMEEMAATVKTNAENASSAMKLAAEASARADNGGSVVAEAVKAMGSIEDGSRKIADIVTVIDGFAFQTNLLALNAAVEAARAGEAGKGFAVVASEVRTLAQRSAEAARDIKVLIQESSGQVADGVRLVRETGTSLSKIVDAIREVSDTVTQISDASREQSAGVDEITSAITAMDETTQQNAALADESANAARGLNKQAAQLRDRVAYFSIDKATAQIRDWYVDPQHDATAAQVERRQSA